MNQNSPKTSKSAVSRAAVILGAFVAASVAVSGIPSAVESAAPVFSTLSPELRAHTDTISGDGELAFTEEHDVTSALPLVIKHFTVKEGDLVSAGDVIATVDRKSSAALIESLGKIPALAVSAANLSTAVALIPEEVTADCTGRVIGTSGNGCAVQSGSSIASVAAEDTLVVTAAVSELDIAKVELGQAAKFTLAAYPDMVFEGTVSKIANAARSRYNGSVLETVVDVEILPKEKDYRLKSGLSADVDIVLSEARQILVLPFSAIGQDDNGEYVYVREDGKAVRRNVRTGEEFADGAEIVEGLSPEDAVFSDPEEISRRGRIRIESEVSR